MINAIGRNTSFYDSDMYRVYRDKRNLVYEQQIALQPYKPKNPFLYKASAAIAGTLIACCFIPFMINVESNFVPKNQIHMIYANDLIQQSSKFVVQKPTSVAKKAAVLNASSSIQVVPQYDPNQYANNQEYSNYWQSACSSASMTAVINSYGHNYKITDILQKELSVNGISDQLGMLDNQAIDRTVNLFGFTSKHMENPSIQDIVEMGSSGSPVIVDFPPGRWNGGHILVVKGGTDNLVYLVDSSELKMKTMTYASFSQYWSGFAIIIHPKN